MKRFLLPLGLFLIATLFSACGEAGDGALDELSLYNSKTGVMLRLGEDVQSVQGKFAPGAYEVIDRIDERYTYKMEEEGGMTFTINFADDRISGLGFAPQVQFFDAEASGDFFQALACDWKWAGEIGFLATEETVREKIGLPSQRLANETASQYLYAFHADLTLLSAAEYEQDLAESQGDAAAYQADIFFFDGKLFSLGITGKKQQ